MEEEKYQVTGSDDIERKNFMYAPFPANKNVNPKNWDSKFEFWSNEILRCCRFYNEICMTCEKLNERFCDDRRKPSGILVVLSNLYTSGQLIYKSDVSNISPNETWSQWAYNVSSNITSWLWKKYVSGIHEQSEFVVKELLEEYSLALMDYHYKAVKYEKTDNTVPWNVLMNIYKINNKKISEENLTCIIGYLVIVGKCKIGRTTNNEKVVKFRPKGQTKVESVNSMDLEVINLKKSIAKLTMECKSMDSECGQLTRSAQAFAKRNEKTKAKKELVQRQRLQKKLNMKQDALISMKENLRTIQEAESTKMITEAFNSSATLLNQNYKGQGLTVDHVENVMDKVAEANVIVNDVNSALTDGLKNLENEEYDMDELEKELEDLEFDTSLGVTGEGSIEALLPNVPSESPVSSTPQDQNKTNKPVAKQRPRQLAM